MIFNTVGDLVESRGFLHIAPDATISDACALLNRENVGALGVCDGGRLVGIISERDVIRNWTRVTGNAEVIRVADIMTPDPQTISLTDSLADALSRMKRGGFRHLPVMQDGRPVAMISFRDIPTEYRLMHERFAEARQGPEAMAAQ
ncbi:CBS domain-containing protein [Rhodobacterales bacterium HKCCE3408]|nr:CBS domain-containing protein [Rhodobacterales bacterium HKCCE3408]